jgi:hypothetical protein
MLLNEDYDADEILRDDFGDEEFETDEPVDELNFERGGTDRFDDLASEVDDATDLLE